MPPSISFFGESLDPHDPAAFLAGIGRRTYSAEQTAALCDMSCQQLTTAVRDGTFAVKPLFAFNEYRFPKDAIDQLLGDDSEQPVL